MSKKTQKFDLSEGYLVVDRKKCTGCTVCMLACTLVHEGCTNLSFSRIQIVQDSFKPYPDDISLNICRQCANPDCVNACPTEAMHIDSKNGYVRIIDEAQCDGCKKCIEACPYSPCRIIWNHDKNTAMKCDLCVNTPFWNEKGGPDGKQACRELCPMRAISLVNKVPPQKGDKGYETNLRTRHWEWLGFPID